MNQSYNVQQRCPMGSFAYTIKHGDTLYLLAQKYNTSVNAIMAINPGIDPNRLQIGQIICMPGSGSPTPPCHNGFHHQIRAGETFYILSQWYHVSVDAIIRANPGVNPNNLQIGQIICIPNR